MTCAEDPLSATATSRSSLSAMPTLTWPVAPPPLSDRVLAPAVTGLSTTPLASVVPDGPSTMETVTPERVVPGVGTDTWLSSLMMGLARVTNVVTPYSTSVGPVLSPQASARKREKSVVTRLTHASLRSRGLERRGAAPKRNAPPPRFASAAQQFRDPLLRGRMGGEQADDPPARERLHDEEMRRSRVGREGKALRRDLELSQRVRQALRRARDLGAAFVRLELAGAGDGRLDQHGGDGRHDGGGQEAQRAAAPVVVPAAQAAKDRAPAGDVGQHHDGRGDGRGHRDRKST